MRTCKKCQEVIPNRIRIAGVLKNICHRKYCLTCSPWGSHNTRKLEMPLKKRKELDAAHVRQIKMRFERKAKMVEMKGGKCCICAYNRLNRNLAFHHVEPEFKSFNLSQTNLSIYSWPEILEELSKTVLLCMNCHGEVHEGLHKELEEKWKQVIYAQIN